MDSTAVEDRLLDLAIREQAGPTTAVGKPGYDIKINEVANGFIAKVGCQTFVFSNLRDLMEALEMYFTNPDAATKKYLIGDKK